MEIRPLDRETYAGKTFTARYRTNGYYDIRPSETGFQMNYVPFAEPTERSFDDVFFGEWLEDPIAFGAFEARSWSDMSRARWRAGTTASASATSA